jgi:hypothetical protein
LMQINMGLNALTSSIQAPKQVIRNENGMIEGVVSVQ